MPALLVGLQQTFGLTVGSWEFIIGAIFVIIIAIVRRNRLDILAFLTAILTGVGIDIWLYLISLVFIPDQWLGKIAYLAMGVIFIGSGVSIYLQAKFSPTPPDGMQILIEEYFKIKVSTARTVFSAFIVTGAFFLNGPIGIGTIIMVFTLGPIIGFLYPIFQKYFMMLSGYPTVKVLDQQEAKNKTI